MRTFLEGRSTVRLYSFIIIIHDPGMLPTCFRHNSQLPNLSCSFYPRRGSNVVWVYYIMDYLIRTIFYCRYCQHYNLSIFSCTRHYVKTTTGSDINIIINNIVFEHITQLLNYPGTVVVTSCPKVTL